MSLLYALQEMRTPFLDTAMALVTRLGEETIFMVVAIVVFWCVSKVGGYYLLSVGFLGTVMNQFLKMLFRIPRPWVLDPNFDIVESAREAATGYSFPSGHTQSAVGTFGGLARMTKKNWLRWVLVVLVLLVAFSRMYLGVHTPLDVGVSLGIGTVLVLVLWPLVRATEENPQRMLWVLLALLGCSLAFLLFMELNHFPTDTDAHNLESAVANAWKLSGATVGMLIACWLDQKYIRFETKAIWWVQLIKVAVGLALVVAIKAGLKAPLIALIGHVGVANAVRYGLMVLFAGAVWPLAFPLLRKLEKT
ncbi:MAG: phosphatase PAP2 family protein [Oscillospiraceae bacterium]|nr:phosphatase PAP2 family protein [Oscillospiraceae bacterium]